MHVSPHRPTVSMSLHARRRRPRQGGVHQWAAALLVLCLVAMLAATSNASAAAASDTYAMGDSGCTNWTNGAWAPLTGTSYINCGGTDTIRVIPPPGSAQQPTSVTNPSGSTLFDLAASPDGAFLYGVYHNTIYPEAQYRTARRFNRRADGTYALDPTWKLERFPYGANTYAPDGISIAVDAFGDIYFANGLYPQLDTPSVLVKFDADGKYITHMGDTAPGARSTPESWTDGTYASAPTGITVSRDGSKVYSGSYTDSRVMRFDRQGNGTYKYALKWGNTYQDDPQRQGLCVTFPGRNLAKGEVVRDPLAVVNEGKFGVTFDVASDPWGSVFVNSTACKQLSAFTADGTWLYTLQYNDPADVWYLSHTVGIETGGTFWWGENAPIKAIRTSPVPVFPPAPVRPVVDTTAPVLTGFTMNPNGVVSTRAIQIDVNASDAVGITEMRIANDYDANGQWVDLDDVPWAPYQKTFTHQLADMRGTQGVKLQVRDAAGNVSGITRNLIQYNAVNGSPVINDVILPVSTAITNIDVDVNAKDDQGVTGIRFANENENIYAMAWGAWKAPAANGYSRFTHVLTEGRGTKAVYVQVRDAAGNESEPVLRRTQYDPNVAPPVVDATPPVVQSVVITPSPTAYQGVTVKVNATDNVGITQMRAVNEGDCTGKWFDIDRDGVWQAWSATFSHTLSPCRGTKAVFVQVRDAAGNVVDAPVTRLTCDPCLAGVAPAADPNAAPADAIAPVLNSITVTPVAEGRRTVKITINATDNVGVKEMRVVNEADDAGNWIDADNAPWTTFAPSFDHLLSLGSDTKSVRIMVRDGARNESRMLTSQLIRCVPCSAA